MIIEKKQRIVYLSNMYCCDLDGSIYSAIEVLNRVLESVPEEFRDTVELDYNYEDSYSLYYCREETDEEYNERVNKLEIQRKSIQEKEKAQLKDLIAKYGVPSDE